MHGQAALARKVEQRLLGCTLAATIWVIHRRLRRRGVDHGNTAPRRIVQPAQFISEPTRSGGQWGLTQDDWGRRYFNYNSDFLRCDLLPECYMARSKMRGLR